MVLSVVAALPPLAWLWGFTVDDALISARMAHHLAVGLGYRFNPGGPIVDAVTPLGYAHVLSLFAKDGPRAALGAARLLGALAWLLAAALLGVRAGRQVTRAIALAPLAVIAVSAPLAAWAVSGMETGIVTLFGTLALFGGVGGALAAGFAAAWRPELAPWALVLSCGLAFAESPKGSRPNAGARRALVRALVVLALPVLVAAVREWQFGHVAPLAVLTKPPDLGQGVSYALAALIVSGPMWLLLAPRQWRSLGGQERWIAVAVGVHFAAMALAGGDWMWMFRLFVPVIPSVLVVATAIAERAPWPGTALRVSLAAAVSIAIAAPRARDGRRVLARRDHLIEAGRTALATARHVATDDVGWVGAATPGSIVDLAGATDPEIAALPGSHTSKHLYPGLLASRDVDAMVLLLAPDSSVARPWTRSHFARDVERRVAHLPDADGFEPVATLPLGGGHQDYLVVRRRR